MSWEGLQVQRPAKENMVCPLFLFCLFVVLELKAVCKGFPNQLNLDLLSPELSVAFAYGSLLGTLIYW